MNLSEMLQLLNIKQLLKDYRQNLFKMISLEFIETLYVNSIILIIDSKQFF